MNFIFIVKWNMEILAEAIKSRESGQYFVERCESVVNKLYRFSCRSGHVTPYSVEKADF